MCVSSSCLTVNKIGFYYITCMYWKAILKIKPARNRHNWLTAGQWHTSHITYCWHLIQSMIWCSVRMVHQGHTKLPVRSPGKQHFVEVSGTHHTQRHSAKVPKETNLAWSGIPQTCLTDQAINQWQNLLDARFKAKGKHFKHMLWCGCL